MFSGGRDSSLAAARLATIQEHILLVTMVSDHLVGLDRVEERLVELSRCGVRGTWLAVRQPDLAIGPILRESKTCLPCQLSYAFAGAGIAKLVGSHSVAFAYTDYQATWPEQTPLAISILQKAYLQIGLSLQLPVRDLASKGAAVDGLRAYRMSPVALEQKCLRAIQCVAPTSTELSSAIAMWSAALEEILVQAVNYAPDILVERQIG
jgi:hypothetical protein